MKPYWETRLRAVMTKPFKLRLLNGMTPPVPEASVMVERIVQNKATNTYELHLGEVLGVKHWDRKREKPG